MKLASSAWRSRTSGSGHSWVISARPTPRGASGLCLGQRASGVVHGIGADLEALDVPLAPEDVGDARVVAVRAQLRLGVD